MKIALIQPRQIKDWEQGEPDRIRALVQATPGTKDFTFAADPEEADLVVLLDSCSFKTWHDIGTYEALIASAHSVPVYCINYEDAPPGFLPGLYSSLEAFRFDPASHVSWPHLRLPNERVESFAPTGAAAEPHLLFSFAGSCSHPLRRKLFDSLGGAPQSDCKVVEIKRWYDHDDAEKAAFVTDIVNSRFVLCPRGIASYSHRIIETMALGRVPIVIADHWVPFGISEQDYYVRIPENDITRLAGIVREHADRFPTLRRNVERVYAKYFAPQSRYAIALNRLVAFARGRRSPTDAASLRARWQSRAFWKRNGWCLEDRILGRMRKLIA